MKAKKCLGCHWNSTCKLNIVFIYTGGTPIAVEVPSNEISLVIRTRSQKAPDGQIEDVTSVETVPTTIDIEPKTEEKVEEEEEEQ